MATHVGVLRLVLDIPGSRSLKDRRRAIRSLRDRVLHRWPVTWNEIDDTEQLDTRAIVCTSASADPRALRSAFDAIRHFVETSGQAWPRKVDVDVFVWQPPEPVWSDHE